LICPSGFDFNIAADDIASLRQSSKLGFGQF
jgi:hypothetical protein